MIIWRISEFSDLLGKGGLLFSARWNEVGLPIVYTADHPASALCEMLVHSDFEDLPQSYQLLKIEVGSTVKIERPTIPKNLVANERATQEIGTSWLRQKSSAVLEVPSIIIPGVSNFLLNPLHQGIDKIKIMSATRIPMDSRFRVKA